MSDGTAVERAATTSEAAALLCWGAADPECPLSALDGPLLRLLATEYCCGVRVQQHTGKPSAWPAHRHFAAGVWRVGRVPEPVCARLPQGNAAIPCVFCDRAPKVLLTQHALNRSFGLVVEGSDIFGTALSTLHLANQAQAAARARQRVVLHGGCWSATGLDDDALEKQEEQEGAAENEHGIVSMEPWSFIEPLGLFVTPRCLLLFSAPPSQALPLLLLPLWSRTADIAVLLDCSDAAVEVLRSCAGCTDQAFLTALAPLLLVLVKQGWSRKTCPPEHTDELVVLLERLALPQVALELLAVLVRQLSQNTALVVSPETTERIAALYERICSCPFKLADALRSLNTRNLSAAAAGRMLVTTVTLALESTSRASSTAQTALSTVLAMPPAVVQQIGAAGQRAGTPDAHSWHVLVDFLCSRFFTASPLSITHLQSTADLLTALVQTVQGAARDILQCNALRDLGSRSLHPRARSLLLAVAAAAVDTHSVPADELNDWAQRSNLAALCRAELAELCKRTASGSLQERYARYGNLLKLLVRELEQKKNDDCGENGGSVVAHQELFGALQRLFTAVDRPPWGSTTLELFSRVFVLLLRSGPQNVAPQLVATLLESLCACPGTRDTAFAVVECAQAVLSCTQSAAAFEGAAAGLEGLVRIAGTGIAAGPVLAMATTSLLTELAKLAAAEKNNEVESVCRELLEQGGAGQ